MTMEQGDGAMWMVRAGQDGTALDRFLDEEIAYLSWNETGAIAPETTFEDLRGRVTAANPTMHPNAVGHATRLMLDFCQEVQIGDDIITYDPRQRQYHIGTVQSGAEYGTVIWIDGATGGAIEEPGYVRRVAWGRIVSRDGLSETAQNYLGRPPTLFRVPAEVSAEVRRLGG